MSSTKSLIGNITEQEILPFGDWILSRSETENYPQLISKDDFLKQLEIQVNQ